METIEITANNLTLRVQRWLQKPQAVTLLHLFDQVINLIDADGEIISVVQPKIRSGPFSLLVEEERPFPHLIPPHAPVAKTETTLIIGPLEIEYSQAKLWQPIPNWHSLHEGQVDWRSSLPEMQTAVNQRLNFMGDIGPANFRAQFQTAIGRMQALCFDPDHKAWQTAVAQLAGFGPGFTPAGDDFLVGFLFGLWATRPAATVAELAKIVVETAVPRTTQLSAAWLQAAGRGEAWLAWHDLVDSFSKEADWKRPVERILEQGATSGIAALLGFITAVEASNIH